MFKVLRAAQRRIIRALSHWVVNTFGLCGVGPAPPESLHSVHGRRELEKIVTSSYAPNQKVVLSARWKVLAKLSRWKLRQLMIMLVTVWSVRGLVHWELELLIEILKTVRFQGVEYSILVECLNRIPPKRGESINSYRLRMWSQNREAYWLLGSILEAPKAPLRSASPRRMASLVKSYKRLLRWITSDKLPATQFHTVEKRRKRGYNDHGSLSSRSYADKQLATELASLAYERWPPWRKIQGYASFEEFLAYVLHS